MARRTARARPLDPLTSPPYASSVDKMTPDQFLEWERAQPERHEYWHGEVFLHGQPPEGHEALAMSGGTLRHALLSAEMSRLLGNGVRGPCRVYSGDQKIAISNDVIVYADVVVLCGPELRDGTNDTVVNPKVVVEVLSKSTESHDRGMKQQGYLSLPSVECLLLVAQSEARVELYERHVDGGFRYRTFRSGDTVRLDAIATSFMIDELYRGAFDVPGG